MKIEDVQEKELVKLRNERDLLTQACNLLKDKISEQREYNKISLKDKLSMHNMIKNHEQRIKELERKI